MEIVIGILALKYNLVSGPMFVAIVFGGIISSIILGPWLKHSLCGRKVINTLEFFSHREIIAQLKATDRDSAIRELCVVASEQGNLSPAETLSDAVLKRENSMGTAIEEGIALPHARIPALIRPAVVFGRSEFGIEWNSPDGKPAHFIFLILTPKENDDIQVQILRIIARTMSDKKTQGALMTAGDQREVWQILQEVFTVHQVVRKRVLINLSVIPI